jgi:hypothetical protein
VSILKSIFSFFTPKNEPIISPPCKYSAAGDWYVQTECCLDCGLPASINPTVFENNEEEGFCFMKKQPDTTIENELMLEVAESADLECIRYKGKCQKTIQKLQERNCKHLADHANK